MQKVTILCVGKLKEKFYTEASAEYLKRLQRHCKTAGEAGKRILSLFRYGLLRLQLCR